MVGSKGREYPSPEPEILESILGAVKPISRPEDFERLHQEAIEDQVTQISGEMAGDASQEP